MSAEDIEITLDQVSSPWIAQTNLCALFAVFVDDIDLLEMHGGKAYVAFGIGGAGAIVVVRPDDHVGFVGPLDTVNDMD